MPVQTSKEREKWINRRLGPLFPTRMSASVQIRKSEVGEVGDFDDLLDKLDEKYDGKWVAILKSGDIVADEDLGRVLDAAKEKSAEVSFLFQAHKKGQLFFR